MLERERELARLREAIDELAGGRPGLVVVEGPAGIGKTRLLAHARELGARAGVRVLAARGSDLEQLLAFGVVRQLLERELDARDGRAVDGGDAVRDAIADSDGATAGGVQPRDASFATLHALYRWTVGVCAQRPLLLVVDDLHVCDEPSLSFFGYLAHRLEGLAVALVCSMRPVARHAHAALLGEIVGDSLAVILRPGPLSGEAAAQLVGEHLGDGAESVFSMACRDATGGNPLLLVELLTTLRSERVRPDAVHVAQIARIGPRAVSQTVLVRLARLAGEAVALAHAVAVLGDGADLALAAQLAGLQADAAAAAASELIDAEIVSDAPALGFVHQLVGAAVYGHLPAPRRARMHQLAAQLLHRHNAPAGAVAAQLMRAPPEGAEWVCDVLERAAAASIRAGAPADAFALLRRSLAEPPPRHRLAATRLALGRAAGLVDGEVAVEHLESAHALTEDPLVRGSIALELAFPLIFTGRAEESVAVLRRAAEEIGPQGGDLIRALEAVQLMTALFDVRQTPSNEWLERARRLPLKEGVGAKMLAAAAARQWAYAGGSADACVPLALAALEGGELIAADNVFLSVTAVLVLALADRAEAIAGWDALERDAEARGSLLSHISIGLWRGHTLCRHGELGEAESTLRQLHGSLASFSAQTEGRAHAAAFLSNVLRERGDLAGARRALHAVNAPDGSTDAARMWLDSLTQLLIAEERFEEALAAGQDAERRFAFLGNPIDTPTRSHLAAALYHLDRHDQAIGLATQELERARRWGAPGTVARALRIVGVLEREAGIECLREAARITASTPARLEHAKAQVALGAALRAARRPTEAREPLRLGLDLADKLDAQPLAAHARTELRAAGARPRSTALHGPQALTASERRVSERAAAGQTNRAIAQALFITPKTVELHLRNAYRKLGITRRGQLADKLDRTP